MSTPNSSSGQVTAVPSLAMHFAVCVIFLLIACASVAIRLYSRHLRKASLGSDDYCLIAALVCVEATYSIPELNAKSLVQGLV